jgi:hypothetical protein
MAWKEYALASNTMKEIKLGPNEFYWISFDLSFIRHNSKESLVFTEIGAG